MSKQKFFFGKVSGLNADIDRHRATEQELRDKIAEYEESGDERYLRTYRHFLNQLLASKD